MNENPITNATGLSAVIPKDNDGYCTCLLYTSPSPRDA